MKVRKLTDVLVDKAEGMCGGLPYNTELAGSGGCSIVFWYGDTYDAEKVAQALNKARRARDILYALASPGEPVSFWAHQDIT